MDPALIGAFGTAVGIAISAIIAATAKAVRGKKPQDDRELPLEVQTALSHINELRALTQDEIIERVHSAESRRVILATAGTLEALVLGISRDRDDLRTALRDAREERTRLMESNQVLLAAIQKLTEAVRRP